MTTATTTTTTIPTTPTSTTTVTPVATTATIAPTVATSTTPLIVTATTTTRCPTGGSFRRKRHHPAYVRVPRGARRGSARPAPRGGGLLRQHLQGLDATAFRGLCRVFAGKRRVWFEGRGGGSLAYDIPRERASTSIIDNI